MAQQTLVTPPGYAVTTGNTGSTFPWSRGPSSMRQQNILDTFNFTAQGVTGPILITKLRFRADDGAQAFWTGGSWPNVRIDLASCPNDYVSANQTFANNLAADVRTVYQGQVTVAPGSSSGTGTLAPWYIEIPLQRAFAYDPTAGLDLTMDIYLDGLGWTGGSRAADGVLGSGTAFGSRVYDTTGLTGLVGTFNAHQALVTEFTYQDATTLVPRFVADVTAGPSPLTVHFTDDSYSPTSGGVLAWFWDFNNDGVVDSNQQNPTHTFTTCGDFDVSLSVIDAMSTLRTVVQPAFIRTDLITASFTFTQTAPNTFQFTDTSTPPANSWAWDFDGNGLADSNAQNPTYTFPPTCSAPVTLSVTRGCRSSNTARTVLLASGSVTSTAVVGQVTGQTGSPTVGTCFDVAVTAPEGIHVCGLTSFTHTDVADFGVEVWVTQNSYATKESNQNFWRRVATGSGRSAAGTNSSPTATQVVLDAPMFLPQGNYGIAIYHGPLAGAGRGTMSWNSGAIGPFSNADLTIHPNPAVAPGVSRTSLFGGSSSNYSWIGSFHYTKSSLSGLGGYGFVGSSCFGTRGFVANSALTTPRVGQTLTTQLTNMPLSIGLFWFGVTRYAPPVAGAAFGAPGCQLYASLDLSSLVIGANNTATYSIFIPNDPAFVGQMMYAQGGAFDPTLNALGLSSSDGAAFVIGL